MPIRQAPAAMIAAAVFTALAVVGPSRAARKVTKVADFSHQATDVSVTSDGRTFVNFPRWTDDAPISVAEVLPGGKLRPYPDARWNAWRNVKANELPAGDYGAVQVQAVGLPSWRTPERRSCRRA